MCKVLYFPCLTDPRWSCSSVPRSQFPPAIRRLSAPSALAPSLPLAGPAASLRHFAMSYIGFILPSFLPSFLPSSVLSRPPPPPSSSTSCSGPVPKKGMSQKHEMLMSDGASRAASVQSPRVSESPGLWQMLKVQNSKSFGPKSPRKTRIFRSLYDRF